MRFFALNMVLAIVWMFLTGAFSVGGFVVGLAAGFLAIFLGQPFLGSERYLRATLGSVRLIGVFLYELVVANLLLARELIRIRPRLKPALVAFRVPELTPTQTVILGHLISLTPGTLTVDNEHLTRTLYIHTIFGHDPAEALQGARLFARLILEAGGERPADVANVGGGR